MQSGAKRRLIRISVWVAVIAMALTVVSSLATALAASAHAALKSMTPAAGSTVRQAPAEVVLEFTEPISTSFATVTVTGPAGKSVATGKAEVSGPTVTQAVSKGLAAGAYTVSFRVVSADGHPISDKASFTLELATTTPKPAPTPSSSAPTTSPTSTHASHPTSGPTSAAPDPASTDTVSAATWTIAAIGILIALGLAFGLARRGGQGS